MACSLRQVVDNLQERLGSCSSTRIFSRNIDAKNCAGCLVVITDHGPRAEAAQVLGHELLVDNGEGRLEGLEEERQKREEKEVGEERERANTTHG